mgnify:CR=1 FL=1
MNTLRHYWLLALMCCTAVHLAAQELTLEECVGRAQANYPLIRKYDILERTTAVNLSDIRKGWLPQLSVYGQGTVQNETPSFPDVLAGMLRQNGMNLEGLDNWQYKVGADLSQTVWDGGASRSHGTSNGHARRSGGRRWTCSSMPSGNGWRTSSSASCLWRNRCVRRKPPCRCSGATWSG